MKWDELRRREEVSPSMRVLLAYRLARRGGDVDAVERTLAPNFTCEVVSSVEDTKRRVYTRAEWLAMLRMEDMRDGLSRYTGLRADCHDIVELVEGDDGRTICLQEIVDVSFANGFDVLNHRKIVTSFYHFNNDEHDRTVITRVVYSSIHHESHCKKRTKCFGSLTICTLLIQGRGDEAVALFQPWRKAALLIGDTAAIAAAAQITGGLATVLKLPTVAVRISRAILLEQVKKEGWVVPPPLQALLDLERPSAADERTLASRVGGLVSRFKSAFGVAAVNEPPMIQLPGEERRL